MAWTGQLAAGGPFRLVIESRDVHGNRREQDDLVEIDCALLGGEPLVAAPCGDLQGVYVAEGRLDAAAAAAGTVHPLVVRINGDTMKETEVVAVGDL